MKYLTYVYAATACAFIASGANEPPTSFATIPDTISSAVPETTSPFTLTDSISLAAEVFVITSLG